MKKMIVGGLAAGAVALGVTAAVPPQAHADSSGYPDTEAFIAALHRDGMNPDSPDKAVKLGYRICTAMRSGASQDAVTEWLVNPPNPVPLDQATRFVTDAHTYLCPDAPVDGSQSI
jgi:hypothetical protein